MSSEQPKLFGGYVLLKALGRGAMGDVHFARPIHANRNIPTPVVVKRLHGELAERKGFVARFRHEAAVAVSVQSKHIAKVYDVGAVGDTLYIAMEYVDGWPLSKVLDAVLKSGRHASIASVVDLIAGGLEGLEALHTAIDPQTQKPLGIVHRDISPKNLMVGEDGLMRLIDLGLGKSNQQDWRTRTGVVMGSVGYMPPEQARGERVDHRADLYAMGVVAFEMLALRNYIKRGSLTQMMEGSTSPKFMRPSEFRPDVPKGLDEVLRRALATDREERYQSARALREAVRAVVPQSHSDGGMVALLDELFGETREARKLEEAALLALPLPDDNPDDTAPTEVFVMAEGVVPLDIKPTKYVPKNQVQVVPVEGDPTEPVRTAATQIAAGTQESRKGNGAVSSGLIVEALAERSRKRPVDPSASSGPSGVSAEAPFYHPLNQRPGPGRWGSVPLPVLVLCMLFASLLGGIIVAIFGYFAFVGDSKSAGPAVVERLPPSPSIKKIEVSARASALPKADPEVEEVIRTKPRPSPRRARRPSPRPPMTRPSPQAPEPEVSVASLDEKLDRMIQEASRLKQTLPKELRDKVSRFQLDAGRWKMVKDLETKRLAVAELEQRLRALRP